MLREIMDELKDGGPDEELVDTLITVSVISKRLAEKIRRELEEKRAWKSDFHGGPEGAK